MPANGARPLPACAAWAGLKPGCRHLKKIDVPPLEHKTMTTAKSFDICEILKLLPHRYPFLLVDRVLLIDEESMKLTAVKNVTFNEPFFPGQDRKSTRLTSSH